MPHERYLSLCYKQFNVRSCILDSLEVSVNASSALGKCFQKTLAKPARPFSK